MIYLRNYWYCKLVLVDISYKLKLIILLLYLINEIVLSTIEGLVETDR